jgi:hypothetical protein
LDLLLLLLLRIEMVSNSLIGVYTTGLDRHGQVYASEEGKVFLSLRERLPHLQGSDTRIHICKGGERLYDLAVGYYKGLYQRPLDLWPIIAEYQPEPIHDPSVPLSEGEVVLIPGPGYIETVAFGDPLSDSPEL